MKQKLITSFFPDLHATSRSKHKCNMLEARGNQAIQILFEILINIFLMNSSKNRLRKIQHRATGALSTRWSSLSADDKFVNEAALC